MTNDKTGFRTLPEVFPSLSSPKYSPKTREAIKAVLQRHEAMANAGQGGPQADDSVLRLLSATGDVRAGIWGTPGAAVAADNSLAPKNFLDVANGPVTSHTMFAPPEVGDIYA